MDLYVTPTCPDCGELIISTERPIPHSVRITANSPHLMSPSAWEEMWHHVTSRIEQHRIGVHDKEPS